MSGADPLGLLGGGGATATTAPSSGGGGNGADPLGLLGGGSTRQLQAPAPSGPAPAAAPRNRSIFGQIEQTIASAPVGLAKFAAAAGNQFFAQPIEDLVMRGGKMSAGERRSHSQYAGLGGDVTSGLLHGFAQTGQHIGAAATGHNPYGEASRQGNTVGAVLGDFANLALPFEAGGKIAEAASTDAAAQAAEHASAAEAAAKATQEAYKAHTGLLSGAAAGDPAAAAQAVATRAEIAAREAEQQAARGVAETSAARAERLTQLSRTLKTIAAAGNQAAGSPFAPMSFAGSHLVAPVAKEIFGHLAETGLGEKVTQALQDHAEKVGVRQQLRDMRMEQQRAEAPVVRAEQQRSGILGGDETLKAAQYLHSEGIAPAIATAAAHAPPEVRAALEQSIAERTGTTPEAAHLAVGASIPLGHPGALPSTAETFRQAEQPYRQGVEPTSKANYLSEYGELKPNPAGAGYRQWNVEGTTPRLQPEQRKSLGLPRQGDPAVERLGTEFSSRYAHEMNQVQAAPARYRPMLATARAVRNDMENLASNADRAAAGSGDAYRSVAAEIAVTLKDATDAGINPPHYIGGEMKPSSGFTPAGAQLPRARKTGNRERKTGISGARTGDERARLYAQRVARQVQNEYVKRIGATFGQTARDLLGENRVNEIVSGEGPKFTGQELLDAAPGRSAWNPASPFATPVRKAEQISPDMLDNVVMMPDHILKEFGRTRNTADTNTLVRAYDRANQGVKTAWLGLSGRYLVGRVIGHSALASIGAGISPVELWSRMADARQIFKQGAEADPALLARFSPRVRAGLDEGAFAPPELINRGEVAQMFPKQAFGQEGENRALHAIKWSRRFTNKIDNLANMGVYMAHLDRGLSAAGYEDFLTKYPEFKGMPRAQVEREAAVRLTLRVLGDFGDMSPIERNAISRVVFFYPWMRHVTRLAFSLAAHNPVRTAWVLHLADMFNGQPDTGIPWLDPAFQMGGNNFVRYPSTFNPFESLTRLSPIGDNGLDPTGALGSVSPVISGATGLLTGADLSKGLQQIARPPGSAPLDQATGAPEAGPLVNKPREALNYLGGLVPQIAALREAVPSLIGHEPKVRYPTGEAVHYQLKDISPDQFTPGGRGLAKLVQLLGLPYEQNVNVEQIHRTAQSRLSRNRALQRSYARGGRQGTPVPAATGGGTAADPLGLLNGK